ncbi:SPFH domain-containing protein [Gemmatimonas sp.]|uniref:flotillin family protein n=1 Tax=Gemmatimonas sp. TaxID=1962908 RepID=UPI00286BA2B6|nr:SPFH domain-containing protein [Gemmatimonas sp.]
MHVFAMLPLLQASSVDLLNSTTIALAGAAFALILFVSLVLLFVTRYKRCPANRVLVISGRVGGNEAARCISGGGAFVWPVIQEFAYLSLEPMQINIPLKDALSFENIRVAVPSVFTVAVGSEAEVRQNAAMRLLGRLQDAIMKDAQDIIFGQLRQVIASMTIDQINRDRDGFLHKIQLSLEPELRKIGLVLINVNIHDLRDESGYIEAIGRKAAATAVQQARGDVADQERMGEVRVAEAEREKMVLVANASKDREIGLALADRERAVRLAELDKERQVGEQMAVFERDTQVKDAQRLQAVRIAQFDKEQKIGEQTAIFERDAMVKEAEQKKRVAVADADARAIAGEAESQALIVATQAQLSVRQAEAYQMVETKKREAEAAVVEAGNRAQTRAALADAERVEAEQRARLEAPAKAEKARTIVEAEADAERQRIHATAEAAAIFAKLDAQARGEYEVLSKRAEALGQLVEKAGGAREAFQLLMVDQIPLLAESAAKAISNIKFDKVVVWEGGNNNANGGLSGTAGFIQNMAKSMPPMMDVLRTVAGVELPAFLGTMTPETTPSAVPTTGTEAAKGEEVAPVK